MLPTNFTFDEINRLLEKLKRDKSLSIDEFKNLLEFTYNILQIYDEDEDIYNLALACICYTSEYLPDNSLLHSLLIECINSSRIFLYRDMIEKRFQSITNPPPSLMEEFAREFYTLRTGTVLTKQQKILFKTFQNCKRIIVSAPTSFGKSRVINEIINENDYKNIAIILPTVALLTETFIRFRKDNNISTKYNLVNTLKQPLKEKNNILIFTPERMDLFMDENPKFEINFFVMDEIYKIQDDGDRSKIFTNCLYRLSKQKADFYLIGPYFDEFSKSFIDKTNSIFLKFSAEIVQKEIINFWEIKDKTKVNIGNNIISKYKGIDTNLKHIIKATKEQSLIYVGDKRGVESKAKAIAKVMPEIKIKSDFIEYLESTISKEWSLVECLKKGVAFHHAGIPKFIQIEIVDSFNNGEIQSIVCSPTLIEGVNTSAKQIIIYNDSKGTEKLTDFDIKNINGRAGRFLQHFIGRSISLIELPKNSEKKKIDFSFFDNELNNEEIIQVNIEDLKNKNLEKRQQIEKKLNNIYIPIELIKKNKFIPIENQISLINYFRKNIFFYQDLQFEALPKKEQLGFILELIHEHLFVDKYKNDKGIKIWNLIYYTKGYVYRNLSLKQLIEQQDRKTIDAKIRAALDLMTKYFEFALPKYLTVFQNLFNFVCEETNQYTKKINLELLILKLEYGFTEPHQIALKEVGVPSIIINNISKQFKECNDINEIREKYFKNPNIINSLHPFEIRIFKKHI